MRQRANAAVAGGIAIVIAYYSIRPIPGVYDTGGAIAPATAYHAAAYFALAGALLLYFHDTPRGHIEAIIMATTFGILMEGTQLFLVNRIFTAVDIAANTAGASTILLDHRSRLVTRIIATEDRILDSILPGDHTHR